jgi:F-box/TPR repeat protein Pof3
MSDKLAHKCSPPKAIDPILMLPVEIAEMVINYLEFKNLV